jgi:predicted dehydrogenase
MLQAPVSRRQLLKGAVATAATFSLAPRHVLGGPGRKAPSDVLTQGTIGTGGMGMGGHVAANQEGKPPVQLAVCDVDKDRLAAAVKKAGSGCTAYADWREVIDRKDVDIIHCATPPHWHSLVTIAAMQAGKDVYCEKPMTRFIAEGQAVIRAARRYGRMVQYNTYGRGGWQQLRKLVASGLLGTPLTVRLCRQTGYGFKVKEWSGMPHQEPQPIPPQLDYSMWLGPAPYKPYHPHRVHGSFRGYWDYDGGGLTDMGQHWYDPIHYFLGKDGTGPVEIDAYAPWPAHPDACGIWGRLTFKFDDGTAVIFESGEWGEPEPGDHWFLEGPKGRYNNRDRATEPLGLLEDLKNYPEPPRLVDFGEAVRIRRDSPGAHPNAEEAHRSVSCLHLCNIAIRMGRRIRWDPVKEEVVGDEEANRLVNVAMRAPWHL